MKFLLKNIISFLLSFFLVFAVIASDLVLLVTTDIHGNINSDKGGFLKLSSAIKEQEAKEGKDKTLLIDCGDTMQGSFEAAQTKGGIAIQLLNLIGYDFWIPGNHDFDYGFDIFLKRASEFRGITLCSNLKTDISGKKPFVSYSVITKNKLKIVIIGATFPNINNSDVISPDAPFRTFELSLALQKVMPHVLREEPDLIVLAVHGGLYNKGWLLTKEIKKYPQIDIVLGGHTHEPITGRKLYNGAYYLQTGHSGEVLGRIDVTKNKENGRFDFASRLIKINSYQTDQELKAKIGPELSAIEKQGEKEIAFIDEKQSQECGILISKAMKNFAQSDVAVFGLSRKTNRISGSVTLKEAYDYAPHEDLLSTMLVTKDELKLIIEELYKHKKKNTKYRKVYWSGFNSEISKKGKVLSLTLPEDLEKKEKITVVIPAYYIEYPTIKFPEIRHIAEQKEAQYKNLDKTVREVFISYLSSKYPLDKH